MIKIRETYQSDFEGRKRLSDFLVSEQNIKNNVQSDRTLFLTNRKRDLC